MGSESFFDARTCYEEGLRLCCGENTAGDLKDVFSERIDTANRGLAERNLNEAEFAYSRGDADKAIDHLELVKTLTGDLALCEKADMLILSYAQSESDYAVQPDISSCASCAGSPGSGCSEQSPHSDDSLPLMEYYELLIQQLPGDQCQRYTELGEDFAHAYIAASRDEHHEALAGFDDSFNTVPHDIYLYEKGKVLHRLGNDREAEQHLRKAIELNGTNPLAWLTLVLILQENLRFHDALSAIETMVAEQIMPEQTLLLRADIYEAMGNHDGAVDLYIELLQTPFARAAAEKLYGILLETGRQGDAAVIFKKYLNKSCH
ncbi:MAG: tetratricopeptide repeat protein [Desulfuromonadaceae bacterium]|nr:tetratricopeptide repeat protein [Desulfuromonadaceae bacterium]